MAILLDIDTSDAGFDEFYRDAAGGCNSSIAAQPNNDVTYNYRERPDRTKTAALVNSIISACVSMRGVD